MNLCIQSIDFDIKNKDDKMIIVKLGDLKEYFQKYGNQIEIDKKKIIKEQINKIYFDTILKSEILDLIK